MRASLAHASRERGESVARSAPRSKAQDGEPERPVAGAIRYSHSVVHGIVVGMKRRRIALGLAILWIVGFEVMPWAHIALHDHLAPHHHDAKGADIIDDDHDAEVDEHAAHHPDDDLDAEVDEHGVPVHVHELEDVAWKAATADLALFRALHHGAHSLAHHGIAVPVPAPAITTPLPVDRRPITVAMVEQPAWISAPIPDASARGPPAPV
jgi:hypothetical protein